MYEINDTETFHWLTYRQTGYFMFFTALFLALFPVLKYLYSRYVKSTAARFSLDKIFLISGLVSLSFYFFNTEMHERYAHPTIVLLSGYAFTSGNFFPLILGSAAYFLNLEKILMYLHLHTATYENSLLFDPRFVAGLYLLLILAMYYLLYKKEGQENGKVPLWDT